jgi:hypothetical protein
MMDPRMGSQTLTDVQIPLLWGSRAVAQDPQGRLSVTDLSSGVFRPEIINDRPAPGVPSRSLPGGDAFEILSQGKPIYRYDPREKTLTSVDLGLPECQVTLEHIRVGSSVFSGNTFVGCGVGIAVTEDGVAVGAPLPPSLAELVLSL